MAQQVFGPSAVVSVLNRAFTNTSPSNAVFANQVATAGTTEASQLAFAKSFGASYAAGKTAADLSALLLTNMGITNAALATALTDYIAANGTQNVGIIAWQLSSILSNLENDGTYGAAAKAWNAEVTAAYEYSADVKNTTPSTGSTTGNEAGKSLVLTVGQDVLTGASGADNFRAVAGNAIGQQDQTTLNSSDIIDGGAGADAIIVNLLGNYGGGARIKGVETLQLGSNVVGNVNFDYNVNAGFNEISDVTKIVYDQINFNESLTVINVIKTADALPQVAWYNDSSNAPAGTATVNYRAAQVTGAADTQAVEFNNVSAANTALVGAAQLNIGAGIETVVLGTATGSSAITLNNTANADITVNAVAADIISTGSLTRVELVGASAFGKAAGVIATTGLTDRVVAGDLGITAQTTTTSSNLLSVGSRVTTVDASKLTADSNVRFTAKNDNSDTNVTFLGGTANDYVEFERGAVNADGGTGADTFAFVTQAAGITNSGFGSTDTVKGGTGSDTVQIGLNGVGTYTLNTTEFNNKTGIEVVDLRGQNNDVTVSSGVVAAIDTGKFTIRTDKMVQSAAGTADATGGSAAESTSTSVINLTDLAQNQGVVVIGGSGSERVVVDNAALNAAVEIDGGTNGGVAGRYDTLTILDTTVADDGDLANVKGIESIILSETVNGNSRFDITLTAAFLLNNTAAVNAVATTIDDSVFRIGSATSSTGTALNPGDVVTVDISGLLNATRTGLAATLAGRGIDVTLPAGVTVNYVVDGAAATAAQIGFVTKADANRADAGVSAAAGAVLVPNAFTGTAAADAFTLTANNNNVEMLAGNDTLTVAAATPAPTGNLNGGDGTDGIVLTAASNLSGASITGFETLTGNFAVSLTAAQYAALAVTNTAAVTLVDAATVAAKATAPVLTLGNFTNSVDVSAAAAFLVTGGTGADTFTATANLTNADTLIGGAGTDTLVLGFDFGGALDLEGTVTWLQGVEVLNITANQTGAVTLDAEITTVNASTLTNALTVAATTAASTNLTFGAGADVLTSLTTAAAARTINFGTGNATVTDIATNVAGFAQTFGLTNTAASTTTLTFAATTANLKTGDVFDFNLDVASIKTGATNAVNQLIVADAGGNTTLTFDVNGDGNFGVGEFQVVITGQVITAGALSIVGGNVVLL